MDDGKAGWSSIELGVGRRHCLLKNWSQTQAVGIMISKVLVANCSSVSWMKKLRCSKDVIKLSAEVLTPLVVFRSVDHHDSLFQNNCLNCQTFNSLAILSVRGKVQNHRQSPDFPLFFFPNLLSSRDLFFSFLVNW